MINRFRMVTPNLFRGSAPSPQDVAILKNKFGIKKIVSLDERAGKRINRVCKLLGIKHIMLPIDIINLKGTLLNFLKHDLKETFLENGPTFVHCEAGKDRTGLAIALVKCKYFGMKPEKALEEAKSLGFGINVNPYMINIFEKLIRACKPAKDINNADIVSNEREYISDNRSSFLDEGHQGSFAPYLSKTRQNPMDALYVYVNDQSPTRDNYQQTWQDKKENIEKVQNETDVPLVGIYDNGTGARGFGPVEPNPGGFIYD